MSLRPVEITLDLTPRARFDIIDVAAKISDHGDLFRDYRKTVCCSFHTTAGYLEQRFCAKLEYNKKRLDQFISTYRKLFPPDAGYLHDRIELRKELSEDERERESINADSHLIFISAGLNNCVTYVNKPKLPIYFIDLDGIYKHYLRSRRTTILAYNKEEAVYRGRFFIPVTAQHPINSFNLKDPRYGLFSHLNELLDSYGIERGLIDISLAREERHAGLTVNEYETLLMRNDLPEAMHDPLRYIVRHGRELLKNPASIPGKTRSYAIYDLIHLYNELMDNVPGSFSIVDKLLSYLSAPASRIFRLKSHISLLVSDTVAVGHGRIVQGTYQSPILVQYRKDDKEVRCLEITLWNFE
ncbi:MAG TPA: hypothetical protein VLB01_01135 [Thermodesulfobacteriota bacterium]|nr:hypothetical protein [Thermodesulfobacteriota bacterium]